MRTLRDAIRGSAWAGTLTAAQLDRVMHEGAERPVRAGAVVCGVGSPVDHWLGIIEGSVKLTAATAEGRSSILTGYAEGAWFGEGSLLRVRHRRYGVVALRESRIALVPRPVFDWLIDTSPLFRRFVTHQLNERLSDFMLRMEHERLGPLDRYVAYCLATLFDPPGARVARKRIEVSQRDVGELTGHSRQKVNRALQRLEAAGLVQLGYRCLTVTDSERLRAYGADGTHDARR